MKEVNDAPLCTYAVLCSHANEHLGCSHLLIVVIVLCEHGCANTLLGLGSKFFGMRAQSPLGEMPDHTVFPVLIL